MVYVVRILTIDTSYPATREIDLLISSISYFDADHGRLMAFEFPARENGAPLGGPVEVIVEVTA